MANEKIHEYVDQVGIYEIQNYDIMVDTEVFDGSNWLSKKLLLKDSILPYYKSFGEFYMTGFNWFPSGTNLPRPILFNSAYVQNQIGIGYDAYGQPSIISVVKGGYFEVQATLQVARSSGGSVQELSLWLRQNGSDINDSNMHVSVVANTSLLVINYTKLVYIGDYQNIQLMWSVTDANIYLKNEFANGSVPHPATSPARIIIKPL
jgi:hypothetical protein